MSGKEGRIQLTADDGDQPGVSMMWVMVIEEKRKREE